MRVALFRLTVHPTVITMRQAPITFPQLLFPLDSLDASTANISSTSHSRHQTSSQKIPLLYQPQKPPAHQPRNKTMLLLCLLSPVSGPEAKQNKPLSPTLPQPHPISLKPPYPPPHSPPRPPPLHLPSHGLYKQHPLTCMTLSLLQSQHTPPPPPRHIPTKLPRSRPNPSPPHLQPLPRLRRRVQPANQPLIPTQTTPRSSPSPSSFPWF